MSQLAGYPVLILKEGSERTTGKSAREKNILAIQAVAEAVKSTLGPRGMDKMMVDSLGDITVTNDGATILNNLEVDHPGAKMAIAVAKNQDENVGDGTTSSVIFAGHLLTVANELMNQGIHPTVIAHGFSLAAREARAILKNIASPIDIEQDADLLKKAAMTTMNSKGISGNKDFFADIAVEAFSKVKGETDNMAKVKNIQIVKKKGKSVRDSMIVDGLILEKEPVHPLMPRLIHDAKIALMEQAFEIKKTEIGTEMRIQHPEDIQSFLDQEDHILKRFADKLQELGVNFVVNSKGVDDTAAHYLNKVGITAIKSVSKSDLENLQRAIGGKISENIDVLEDADLGAAQKVEFKKIGNDELCFISGCTNPKAVSILLRAGSNSVIDEADRSLHDALCVVASLHDRSAIVGGGGAVEMEICKQLLDFAKKQTGKEQIAIETFARALEIIPITLAENAGLDPINIIAELRSKHSESGNEFMGLDIFQGAIVDNRESGVIEPVANIDQIIKAGSEFSLS